MANTVTGLTVNPARTHVDSVKLQIREAIACGTVVNASGPSAARVAAMAGASPTSPTPDPAVDPDDFAMDHGLSENHVWHMIAARIPQFEAIRVISEWAGHYAYNTLDRNAVVGPHSEMSNFLFIDGFSGRGLQQAWAMGPNVAEWITYGAYQTLDLSPFGYARIASQNSLVETAVISRVFQSKGRSLHAPAEIMPIPIWSWTKQTPDPGRTERFPPIRLRRGWR